MAEYRAARSGPHRWMLGRFIIAASQLEDLGGKLMASMKAGEEPWAISAIFDGEVAGASVQVRAFDGEMEPGAQVALLEVPLPLATSDGRGRSDAFEAARPTVTAALTASAVATPFFEVRRTAGWQPGMTNALAALADHRDQAHRPLGAKLRCGGVAAEAFPDPEQVAEFICEATNHRLPFKATAGLHHPVRHFDEELAVHRHGFLNLLMAAALARRGEGRDVVVAAIAEVDQSNFGLSAAGFTWGDYTVRVGELSASRAQFAAYGSCSFREPIEDLVELGMIKS